MSAITGPVSLRPRPTVLASYERVVADKAHGTWTQPLHAVAWSGLSGASDAPKSTVRAVIAWMPPPEPIGLYDTSSPRSPSGGIHAWTSGSTSDDPAPLSASSDLSPLDDPPHADAPALSKTMIRRVAMCRMRGGPRSWRRGAHGTHGFPRMGSEVVTVQRLADAA